MSEPLDLGPALRAALIGNGPIASQLATYLGEPAVFTRRPVPDGAAYPFILVAPAASVGNVDWLKTRIPMPRHDVIAYGQQPGDYRTIQSLGYMMRQLFHRQPFSITVSGYSVLEIIATGPMGAPVDDANEVGRAVMLAIKVRDLST